MPVTAPADPYKEALERLYGFERGNKGPFGLEGTRALLADLGNPEHAFPSIHVAGTNGKGSTCAFLERILRESGKRTGLFTSPHLMDFRERIRVDGRSVAPEVVTRNLARIQAVPAGSGRTFFEATFALAALGFADAKVDIAVLETGLGGRLDATNVVTSALSVITPIGLDHQDMLGQTIEAIAAEKAGIIKPGVPVLVGRQDPSAMAVLEERAGELGSALHRVADVAEVWVDAVERSGSKGMIQLRGKPVTNLSIGMIGRHQVENAVLAAAAASLIEPRLTRQALADAMNLTRWPGRFDRCPTREDVWWDGAHNPQGAMVLRATWRDVMDDEPATLVLGVSEDKDLDGILAALAGPWSRVVTTCSKAPRAMHDGTLAERVAAAWPGSSVVAGGEVPDALDRALGGRPRPEPVLVCGSLFVVGEAMAALGADLEQL